MQMYFLFSCIISEFKNAAKILLNVWKFIIEVSNANKPLFSLLGRIHLFIFIAKFSQKKLTELIVEVKKSIQERCHANQPNLIEAQ